VGHSTQSAQPALEVPEWKMVGSAPQYKYRKQLHVESLGAVTKFLPNIWNIYIYSDIYVAQSMENSGINGCHQDQQVNYARLRYVSRWHLMITVRALGQSVSLSTI
jgi:hypothetical protein